MRTEAMPRRKQRNPDQGEFAFESPERTHEPKAWEPPTGPFDADNFPTIKEAVAAWEQRRCPNCGMDIVMAEWTNGEAYKCVACPWFGFVKVGPMYFQFIKEYVDPNIGSRDRKGSKPK